MPRARHSAADVGEPVLGSSVIADRLRVIGAEGMNLRINVDDGKTTKDGNLKFANTDMHKGETPKVVAGAYSNSFKGTKETALYDVDATIGFLKQAPPNDGVLNAIGKLRVKAESYAFIASDGNGGNERWLMADGTLYKVDQASGKATEHDRRGRRHREGHRGPSEDVVAKEVPGAPQVPRRRTRFPVEKFRRSRLTAPWLSPV